jgi:hypothetical protein
VRARFGPEPYALLFSYVRLNFLSSGDHVLTREREEHAVYVAACAACDYCVLLEGPAAVGKSSLVMTLASCWDEGRRYDGSTRQVAGLRPAHFCTHAQSWRIVGHALVLALSFCCSWSVSAIRQARLCKTIWGRSFLQEDPSSSSRVLCIELWSVVTSFWQTSSTWQTQQ